MARYRYAGDGPRDDGRGGLVRPGDVWEWPGEPDWGPWELLGGGAETDSAATGTQPPADGTGSPAAASEVADASGSAPGDGAGKGM